MNQLIAKLTSYNLFNYLLPGIVFVVLSEEFTPYSFRQDDLLLAFFVYYFIGLVISRVGSLLVEPALRWIGFVKFAPYEDFVRRSRDDPKLEILSEANNTYRTLLGIFVSLGLLSFASFVADRMGAGPQATRILLVGLLTMIFLLAYRKQTGYIRDRIKVE